MNVGMANAYWSRYASEPVARKKPGPHPASLRTGWEDEEGFKAACTMMPFDNDLDIAGVVVDSSDPKAVLYDTSETHKLIIGSTGSGKSRRIIGESILSLLGTRDIGFVHDPKGEEYRHTSQPLRDDGFNVVLMDHRDPRRSAGFNVFSWPFQLYSSGVPRDRDLAFDLVLSIAQCVCPVMDIQDPYWEQTAQSTIAGLTWATLKDADKPEDVTFENVFRLSNEVFATDKSIESFKRSIRGDPLLSFYLEPSLTNAPLTRNCVLSTMRSHLLPFVQSESVNQMLSRDDIRFADIMKGKCIIYLVSPEERSNLNPLISIFVKLLYEYALNHAYLNGTGRLEHCVHMFLDEFGNLPPISGFQEMMTASRSRNIRFVLAVQSLGQIDMMYGRQASAIKGNCLCWIFLSSKDLDTLEEVSKIAGEDGDGRRLISTTALQRLDRGEALVLMDRRGPYITHLSDISKFGIEPIEDCLLTAGNDTRCEEHTIPDDLLKEFVEMFSGDPTCACHTDTEKRMVVGKVKYDLELAFEVVLEVEKYILDKDKIDVLQEFCDLFGHIIDPVELVFLIVRVVKAPKLNDSIDVLNDWCLSEGFRVDGDALDVLKRVRSKFRGIRSVQTVFD